MDLINFAVATFYFAAQNFHLDVTSHSSDDLLNTCRICRDETVRESLVSPCECSGTLGKCHVQCLEEWLSKANKNSCEICGHKYQTTRIPRSFKEVCLHDAPTRHRFFLTRPACNTYLPRTYK